VRALAAAAVGVLALVLAGCGGDGKAGRMRAVDSYLNSVNTSQKDLSFQLGQVNQTYRGFSLKSDLTKETPKLREAERSIRRVRARLAALHPPPDALVLHRGLLRLFALDAALAHEVTQITVYLPVLARTLAQLAPEDARLRATLRSAKKSSEQSQAFLRYAAALTPVLARLDALKPPPVLAPTHEAQLTRLTTLRSLSVQLAAAMAQRDRARVNTLVARYRTVQGAGAQVALLRAQAAAIKAYDRRLYRIYGVQAEIMRERGRVERLLN
jgi:hypothetical protein